LFEFFAQNRPKLGAYLLRQAWSLDVLAESIID
jgi:hypothetical protein